MGYSEMWSWRASAAHVSLLQAAGSQCRTGKLSWRWVTLHHTRSCGIHFNAEKEECLEGKAFVQPEFLLSFQVDPMGWWGLRGKSMCPCHSTLTAWTQSFPREIQQKAVEEEKASPATASWGFYAAIAEEGHRGGIKPGRFPQIPKDPQEAGIIIRRHSPLIETSPCSTLT